MAAPQIAWSDYELTLNATDHDVSFTYPAGLTHMFVMVSHTVSAIQSITVNGLNVTLVASEEHNDSPGYGAAVYRYAPGASGGTDRVRVGLGSSSADSIIAMVGLTGAAATGNPVIDTDTDDGSVSDLDLDLSLDPNGEDALMFWVAGGAFFNVSTTTTGDAGDVLIAADSDVDISLRHFESDSSATMSFEYSGSNPAWVGIGVAVVASSAGDIDPVEVSPTVPDPTHDGSIIVPTCLMVPTLPAVTAAEILHERSTITDCSKHGKLVSVEIEHTGDGPNFELHQVDLDMRFRGSRVWRATPRE